MNQSIYQQLSKNIHEWGMTLGFQQVGITDTDLKIHEHHLEKWLDQGYHGEMRYMASHGHKRSRPPSLVENTTRIIAVRMNYLPEQTEPVQVLHRNQSAYVARYTMGRDYHKVIRKRLVKLWNQIRQHLKEHNLPEYSGRVFTDSAPVLEKAIAEKSGLGWIGKNTLLLNREAGSWFFLGEIFTDIPLTVDEHYGEEHCGSCSACIDVCPTDAIVAPYQLDARKCISYLTIEHRGSIDENLRAAMGNRIFGCDDCQLFCPWNKFAKFTDEDDFNPKHNLDRADLLTLFSWTEDEFLSRTEGSAIRRTGYEGWQRNIAISMGNADPDEKIIAALTLRKSTASPMVREHIDWALVQQQKSRESKNL
ncbi:MAG: tRNA epoxyqueuosine(34) reductase QueG [bacterium]|nr:tRNA epoxyqueuosine(34) reductase QueG [Gammaproteobacteria bacterium]